MENLIGEIHLMNGDVILVVTESLEALKSVVFRGEVYGTVEITDTQGKDIILNKTSVSYVSIRKRMTYEDVDVAKWKNAIIRNLESRSEELSQRLSISDPISNQSKFKKIMFWR